MWVSGFIMFSGGLVGLLIARKLCKATSELSTNVWLIQVSVLVTQFGGESAALQLHDLKRPPRVCWTKDQKNNSAWINQGWNKQTQKSPRKQNINNIGTMWIMSTIRYKTLLTGWHLCSRLCSYAEVDEGRKKGVGERGEGRTGQINRTVKNNSLCKDVRYKKNKW